MKNCDIHEATHVKYEGKLYRIIEKWGIDGAHLDKAKMGGFGCVTDTGRRISMMQAEAYYKEALTEDAPKEVREVELYAWVGRDEFGSGEFGLKQGVVPAGTIPMVAIQQWKLDQYWEQAETIARHHGQRIYLVKLKAVEVVRGTKHGG